MKSFAIVVYTPKKPKSASLKLNAKCKNTGTVPHISVNFLKSISDQVNPTCPGMKPPDQVSPVEVYMYNMHNQVHLLIQLASLFNAYPTGSGIFHLHISHVKVILTCSGLSFMYNFDLYVHFTCSGIGIK